MSEDNIPISIKSIKLLQGYIQANIAFFHFNDAEKLANEFRTAYDELGELWLYVISKKYEKQHKEVSKNE